MNLHRRLARLEETVKSKFAAPPDRKAINSFLRELTKWPAEHLLRESAYSHEPPYGVRMVAPPPDEAAALSAKCREIGTALLSSGKCESLVDAMKELPIEALLWFVETKRELAENGRETATE